MYITIILLFSFFVTILGIFFMLRFFPKWKLLDRPHEYGIHNRSPIPYSGGIIFFIVFFVGTLLFVKISSTIIALIVAGFLITFVSFLDDRFRLNPWIRLAVQVIASFILIWGGVQIQVISNPFASLPIHLDQISFFILGHEIWLFSAIAITGWLVLMMNVMNWLDGIPGLTSGVSTIAQISLFILSLEQFHIVDQSAVITISSVLAASTFAFLLFDFYPPKILMGDTGSMFLGFMLGALSILGGGKLATALLIMGFPILDAIWVVLRRILTKKSPLKGDLLHLHHRLLRMGLSERKALLLNYALCIGCSVIALTMKSTVAKFASFMGLVTVMIGIGILLLVKEKSRKTESW